MNYTFRFSGREWFETLPKDVQDEWLKEVVVRRRRYYVITSLVLLESKKLYLYS